MKLYFPKSHYQSKRWHVFPLLRPFLKGAGYSDADRQAQYGVSETDFIFIDSMAEADYCILPMSWNYYKRENKTDAAVTFIKACQDKNKMVLSVNIGDSGVHVPKYDNLIVLRYGGYRSKFFNGVQVLPPQIKDPLIVYFQLHSIIERNYTKIPTIGFCGHATGSLSKAAGEIIKIAKRNLQYYSGFSQSEPEALLATTRLRFQILSQLRHSALVKANFLLRDKYRAGQHQHKDNHRTTLEFYTNIMESDYVVCIRGAGNFSLRFYETLAMGRIPVFINTDCALPFDDEIDWKKHVVWVEYKDRFKVAEKVATFHSALSEEDFINLQRANRKLWEERLTLNGFFKSFLSAVSI